jgi:hypothetical protein
MSDTLLVAFVGFLAAIVGGMIQAWTARRFETARFERHNRNQAYLAYFKGVGELSFAAGDDRATQVAHANMAEARSRIALTGSEPVIDAMNAVFENGADIHSPKARADLAKMLKAMRDDSTGGPSITEADKLFRLAFGDGPRREI